MDELCEVPGIGRRTAETVAAALASRTPAALAVNTATGEIIDDSAEPDRTETSGPDAPQETP